ncbi:unnamed protein product, partial [Trichogramma brassicae]
MGREYDQQIKHLTAKQIELAKIAKDDAHLVHNRLNNIELRMKRERHDISEALKVLNETAKDLYYLRRDWYRWSYVTDLNYVLNETNCRLLASPRQRQRRKSHGNRVPIVFKHTSNTSKVLFSRTSGRRSFISLKKLCRNSIEGPRRPRAIRLSSYSVCGAHVTLYRDIILIRLVLNLQCARRDHSNASRHGCSDSHTCRFSFEPKFSNRVCSCIMRPPE